MTAHRERFPIITLTTDFGLSDGYAGTLHGVIAAICPRARVIDLCHDIPACNVTHAAYVLGTSYHYFPDDTIHVGVVDPGVGGARKAILIRTRRHYFVGPDNGLFTLVLKNEKIVALRELRNEKYFLSAVSRTFHGRDIFAPVAAHLATGIREEKFGPTVKSCRRLADFSLTRALTGITARIVATDRFGNLITAMSGGDFTTLTRGKHFIVHAGRRELSGLCATYSRLPAGEPGLLIGSGGFVEIAMYQGSAAEELGLKTGDTVQLQVSR